MSRHGLIERRLVVVIGKGGVGRSTLAAALGLRAAELGRRTVVAEIGDRGDAARLLEDAVETVTIDPDRALADYLSDQLGVLAAPLRASRSFGYLTAATPGLRELLCVGQVWELAQPRRRLRGAEPFDLVILDAPATGHGLALLAAPRTFARAARVGPIARQAARIAATLADPAQTGVLCVCTPHEAAVEEALELHARTGGAVAVNAVRPGRFATRDIPRLRAALAGTELSPAARRAVELALADDRRVRAERGWIRALGRALPAPPIELPFVFAGLGADALRQLGARLCP